MAAERHMSDEDVAATLRAIRDEALAAARSTERPRTTTTAATSSPAAPAAGPSLRRFAVRLARGLVTRIEAPGKVLTMQRQFLAERRMRAAAQEQRLRQLEEDQVRLRQQVLQLSEALLLANRARRSAEARLDALESKVAERS